MKVKLSTAIIVLLLVIIAGLGGALVYSRSQSTTAAAQPVATPTPMQEGQAAYVKPETPVDRSQNVTLPGWGGFTIPANTTTITKGFEFHNPEENMWYEDDLSINGTALENLVVDSGTRVLLDHYLKLAGINAAVAEVNDYDSNCFAVENTQDGYTLQAIAGYDGTKTITVTTDAGEQVSIDATCRQECYYMTFGLYLSDGDELLYQSDLVAPGMYIQQMEMTRALAPGEYDAYVVCQPYKSDRQTKTNLGEVKITLTAG